MGRYTLQYLVAGPAMCRQFKMCKYNFLFPLILLITVYFTIKTQAFRVFSVDGVETILALENEKINIQCKANKPIRYCGFINPNGKRYSISGNALNAGRCFTKIEATKNVSGQWQCHIGTRPSGVEIRHNIQVRVATQLAAVQQNIKVLHGDSMTIACVATQGQVTLSYCRFEPPAGEPFNINSDVTSTKPILGRYYFPINKSLDRGDCAVTIRQVHYEDEGFWTCGAGLLDSNDNQEYTDVIEIEVEGFYTMTRSSVAITTFAAITLVAFIMTLGVIAWKQRHFLGVMRPGVERGEAHELEPLPGPSRPIPEIIIRSPTEPSVAALLLQPEA